MQELKKESISKMDKVLHDLEHTLTQLRTGRASTSIVDQITIEAYGAQMPLIQMATIGTPDARCIAIQPFDANQIGSIEKAILASDIGITPSNDGKIIRLNIPMLTEDRRKDMVKQVHKHAEEHRVGIRKARHWFIDAVKKMEKAHEISEDDLHRATADEQKIHDEFIKKIDEMTKQKEAEIMEV